MKVCLLGEPAVGKTSIIYRYIENKFHENYISTLGVNLLKKELEVGEYGLTHAQMWDLGGQDSYVSVRKIYLDGSKGALLLYDMTRKETFDALYYWIGSFREIRCDDGDIVLIGTKSDLKDQIMVSHEEASEYAREMGLEYIETSAKSGENVENAFLSLFKKVLDRVSKEFK